MKYEIFSPNNESMGFFDTINDHPGCAQRVFTASFNNLLDHIIRQQPYSVQFEHNADYNIMATIKDLMTQKRQDALYFYFTPVA